MPPGRYPAGCDRSAGPRHPDPRPEPAPVIQGCGFAHRARGLGRYAGRRRRASALRRLGAGLGRGAFWCSHPARAGLAPAPRARAAFNTAETGEDPASAASRSRWIRTVIATVLLQATSTHIAEYSWLPSHWPQRVGEYRSAISERCKSGRAHRPSGGGPAWQSRGRVWRRVGRLADGSGIAGSLRAGWAGGFR